jgi:hypothetical protein
VTAPPGVAANTRAWAGEIEQLLPPLATGHLRDINDDSSGVMFITGTPYYGLTSRRRRTHIKHARCRSIGGSRTLWACLFERFLTIGSQNFVEDTLSFIRSINRATHAFNCLTLG